MLRRLFVLSFALSTIGCGSSETKVTAPTQFLPPTAAAGAGSSGGGNSSKPNDTSGGEKEKFVP